MKRTVYHPAVLKVLISPPPDEEESEPLSLWFCLGPVVSEPRLFFSRWFFFLSVFHSCGKKGSHTEHKKEDRFNPTGSAQPAAHWMGSDSSPSWRRTGSDVLSFSRSSPTVRAWSSHSRKLITGRYFGWTAPRPKHARSGWRSGFITDEVILTGRSEGDDSVLVPPPGPVHMGPVPFPLQRSGCFPAAFPGGSNRFLWSVCSQQLRDWLCSDSLRLQRLTVHFHLIRGSCGSGSGPIALSSEQEAGEHDLLFSSDDRTI